MPRLAPLLLLLHPRHLTSKHLQPPLHRVRPPRDVRVREAEPAHHTRATDSLAFPLVELWRVWAAGGGGGICVAARRFLGVCQLSILIRLTRPGDVDQFNCRLKHDPGTERKLLHIALLMAGFAFLHWSHCLIQGFTRTLNIGCFSIKNPRKGTISPM